MDWSSSSKPDVGKVLGVHVHCEDDIAVRRGTTVVLRLDSGETRRRQEAEGRRMVKPL
jgi:hypothetical protein